MVLPSASTTNCRLLYADHEDKTCKPADATKTRKDQIVQHYSRTPWPAFAQRRTRGDPVYPSRASVGAPGDGDFLINAPSPGPPSPKTFRIWVGCPDCLSSASLTGILKSSWWRGSGRPLLSKRGRP